MRLYLEITAEWHEALLAYPVRCVFRGELSSLTFDVPPSETSAWRAVVRVLRSPLDNLSCALLPSACCVCGNPLLDLSRVPVCDSCWQKLSPQTGNLCLLCRENMGFDQYMGGRPSIEALLCRTCRMSPPPFHRLMTYGAYEKEFRKLVHLLKYNGVTGLRRPLGRLLAEAVASVVQEAPKEMLVVPVPLAKEKQRQRGYNQAELLARSALKTLAVTQPQWRLSMAGAMLQRSRATESQARLTPHQRRRNMRGAFFAPHPEQLQGKHILLIDDVFTTGATARECTRTLLAAGAASVWVGTLTRDQKEGITFWQEKQGDAP